MEGKERLDGHVIEDEFTILRSFVGEPLKLINDAIYKDLADNSPLAFTEMVQLMTEGMLNAFNESMQNLTEKFEGLEFEPFLTEAKRLNH